MTLKECTVLWFYEPNLVNGELIVTNRVPVSAGNGVNVTFCVTDEIVFNHAKLIASGTHGFRKRK